MYYDRSINLLAYFLEELKVPVPPRRKPTLREAPADKLYELGELVGYGDDLGSARKETN